MFAETMTTRPAESSASYKKYALTALFGVTFCYLFYYTGRQTFGFAIPGLQKEFGYSKETLGWVSAAMLWSYAFGQFINGNLGDKWGGRTMMFAGALLSFAANWATSFSDSFTTLIIAWGLNGYFQSMGWAPGARLIANWWGHKNRGNVYAVYTGVSSLSSTLAFLLPLLILDTFGLDWRWIFRLPVLLMVFGALVMFCIVWEKPEERGLTSLPEDRATGAGNDSQEDDKEHSSSVARYLTVAKNWRLYATGISIGFQNAARYALIVWVPVHFFGASWKTTSVAGLDPRWITLALPIGMACGAISNGWISDAVFGGKRYLAIVTFMVLACAVAILMYWVPHGSVLSVIALFGCGFFVYGPASSFWALCPDLFGRKLAGTATGMLNTMSYMFAGLAEPLIGRLMDKTGDTSLIFLVVVGLCAASAVCAATIRR